MGEQRLRTRPEIRFAGEEDVFDLNEAFLTLENEGDGGRRGHRQIALFRHGPATFALFSFEEGGSMDDHAVDGPVTIHVLNGHLRVKTEANTFELTANQMMRLAPGVKHSVEAIAPSRMMLTICVEGPGSHS